MPDEPPKPESEVQDQESPLLYALAVVMFVLPIAGLLFHAFLYMTVPPWTGDYLHGMGIKIVAGVSFANLVGNWLHYRNTRMTLDVYSRLLTYLWIVSIVLLVVHWKP